MINRTVIKAHQTMYGDIDIMIRLDDPRMLEELDEKEHVAISQIIEGEAE
jgi:hypothetical protein